MHLNNIFHDYALVKAPRDLIFGMSTQMTDRNDIRYINLHFLVIRGHKRSLKGHQRSKVNPIVHIVLYRTAFSALSTS